MQKIAVIKGTEKAGENAGVYRHASGLVEVIWKTSGESVKFVSEKSFRAWVDFNTFVQDVRYIQDDTDEIMAEFGNGLHAVSGPSYL